ncbi:SDR family oxidoreductase [Maribacter cobaltidurans]|uniref:Short-chain dehydrogenase n=1 Tax=Maribacter cobaltidurans TaxID=1178778 RepID=A0A223V4V5_9FLAO|nr:SDR family oxidoreductase [Maribacter cobaltidurans]ASV30048.1 short-chain dehydrogenase [Maribacter cobaltidurans]GGD87632.1 short-chain dehydrogenase/reductase [Maribacter cobaltidurans]
MSKTILITGASSGFGKGTAIGLAKKGHRVIAAVHVEPLKTILLEEAKNEGVELEVIVLDVTKESDRQFAFNSYEIDVLMSNAGIMETGPVAEIPIENVRRNYEVNVFAPLQLVQGFLPQMVKRGSGKVIFTSSMGGLITVPFAAIYTSTKHALEGMAEGLKDELSGTGVEICTVNPGVFGTGFNDRGAETLTKWWNPEKSLSKMGTIQAFTDPKGLENQLDPQIMVDAMIRVAEEDNSKFRNVIPEAIVPWIKATQEQAWKAKKNDLLTVDPSSL